MSRIRVMCGCVIVSVCTLLFAGGEYFPYLFQRTTYTDNLLMPGGWWANPALISSIREPFAHTSNALPLGDSLLISSFNLFIPIGSRFTIGGGILGAGAYKNGSSVSSVTNSGVSYSSSFAFKRPRFQLGAAVEIPWVGSLGILGTLGGELRSTGSHTEGVVSAGAGAGWLSPAVAGLISFSAVVMCIHHDPETAFWEKGGKLGLRLCAFDTVLTGSVEYTFSIDKGFGVFTPDLADYEVLKTIVSIRLYERLSLFSGFSTDLDYPYNNRQLAHLGLDLMESPQFPFCGGYDMGFRFGQDWRIMHRIWVGLNLRKLALLRPAASR